MVLKDFPCVAIVPKFEGDWFRFETFLTKNSLVQDGSLKVTSLPLQNFINNTKEGRYFRRKIATGAQPIKMGYITGSMSDGSKHISAKQGVPIKTALVYYTFYPFDAIAFKKNNVDFTFENLLRGKRVGALIEARIFKYFKEKYPHLKKIPLHYTSNGFLNPRREQLKIIRKVVNPLIHGELHSDYAKFKSYLKEKSLENVGIVNWKKKSQRAKKARLKRTRGAVF